MHDFEEYKDAVMNDIKDPGSKYAGKSKQEIIQMLRDEAESIGYADVSDGDRHPSESSWLNAIADEMENAQTESGIMYRAGVKKYGKAGMTAIQSAAGKGASHQEIGKIKDKYLKDDDSVSDKEKWMRYGKFWKYIMDMMAQEAEADIGDGFISADSIDEEPSYTTAKEIMQRAMAKQNTPWNDSIIDSDLDEYSSELNQDYEDKTDFADMKKAAMEMITTGNTQITPYGTYPPMDQMNTSEESINDIVRLSGIK